jgi:hypothetical protein
VSTRPPMPPLADPLYAWYFFENLKLFRSGAI